VTKNQRKTHDEKLTELIRRFYNQIEIKQHSPSLPELLKYITDPPQEPNPEYENHIKGCKRCQRAIKAYREELKGFHGGGYPGTGTAPIIV